MSLRAAALDHPLQIRRADRELLSLALIDARNLTLRWLEVFETRGAGCAADGGPAPLWLAGHAAWYQERWIARNVQRQRGAHGDRAGVRLASIEPRADDWFEAAGRELPDAPTLRSYLADTLEVTLDLLASADDGDDALYFHRCALLHEDRLGEALAERAAALQLHRRPDPPPPLAAPPARVDRDPVWLPTTWLMLGSPPGGFVPDNERWAEQVQVPEFEIDAQPVSWARYVEFAEDGGYDRAELWTPEGRGWLQRCGRRAPRDVEQLRGGAVVQRGGELQRVPAGQPVLHVTRHEAQAWCRWAGRRLPTEPEWELAALSAHNRGFVWGDVFEWVGGSARDRSGQPPGAGSLDRAPPPGTQGVLRGASVMTPPRWRHPKARRFAPPEADAPFCGFRSCAS